MRFPLYFDHNSTTPVDPQVVESMLPYLSEKFGNSASNTHPFGWEAKEAVDKARDQVAHLIGAKADEIVFTSGATESNNLAILGLASAAPNPGHIISSPLEHRAVLDPLEQCQRRGWQVTLIKPGPHGFIPIDRVLEAITSDTTLITLMLANNEIGTVQELDGLRETWRTGNFLVHTDAVQALGKVPLNLAEMPVDLASFSAHKIYGPKGIGALWIRRDRSRSRPRLRPRQFGGGHENGLRSGTLPVPLAVGFGKACELYSECQERERERLQGLDQTLRTLLKDLISEIEFNQPPAEGLPGLTSVRFRGVESSQLLMALPECALSSGSACTSAEIEPSHVLRGIGLSREQAESSIRIGLGRSTGSAEVEYLAVRLAGLVKRLRGLR